MLELRLTDSRSSHQHLYTFFWDRQADVLPKNYLIIFINYSFLKAWPILAIRVTTTRPHELSAVSWIKVWSQSIHWRGMEKIQITVKNKWKIHVEFPFSIEWIAWNFYPFHWHCDHSNGKWKFYAIHPMEFPLLYAIKIFWSPMELVETLFLACGMPKLCI